MKNPTNEFISKPEALPPALDREQDAEAFPDRGMFRAFNTTLTVAFIAWSVRGVSLINLLDAAFSRQSHFINWIGSWLPFEISEGHRFRMFLTSLLLMFLASGLQRGKRLAWRLTILGLFVAPLFHLGRAFIWPHEILNLGLILLLLSQRKSFVALSDERSAKSGLIVSSLLMLGLVIFGTIRLEKLRDQLSGDRSWAGCFQTSCELVFVHMSDTQVPHTHRTEKLFTILRMGGTGIAVGALILLLRPVIAPVQQASAKQIHRLEDLISCHGDDPFNPYALMKDKRYFFTKERDAVVAYSLSKDIAVALADPIGPISKRPQAIREFVMFCRRQDWEPVFYAATDEMRSYYENTGLSLFKIGEGARLQGNEFTLKGGDFQNLRTLCNRAKKLGVTFRWYDGESEEDRWLERQLLSISRNWLSMKKAKEMAFDMGSFSIEDIRCFGAGIAFDSGGAPIAFAMWRPFHQNLGRTLDLMRYNPEARNIIDFVLVESIARFRSLGVQDISLGMAPMANIDNSGSRMAEEWVVRYLFENFNRIYGYKPLFEFKKKYRPKWKGRFLAYRRGASLPKIAWALVRIHAPNGILRFFLS